LSLLRIGIAVYNSLHELALLIKNRLFLEHFFSYDTMSSPLTKATT
jgi:hypothetical protein